MKTRFFFLIFFAALVIHTSVATQPYLAFRQRFVSGKTEHGASFAALRPGPGKDGEQFLQAWAGVGDSFPVKDQAERTLFDVAVVDGDDDHLVMEIRTKEAVQKIDVKRDKSESISVTGSQYILSYPSVSVSSADKATSNQAMIIVSLRAANPPQMPKAYILEIAPYADTMATDHPEHVFIVNGIAYRSLDALKDRVEHLPADSTLTWSPSDIRITKEQPLSSEDELKAFEKHCKAHNVHFIRTPAG